MPQSVAFKKLVKGDLHAPFNQQLINKLMGKLNRHSSRQLVTATLAADLIGAVEGDCGHTAGFAIVSATPTGTATLVIDVQRIRAGVATSLLTAALTLSVANSTVAGARVALPFDPAVTLLDGDFLQVVRTYTAGTGGFSGVNQISVETQP